MPTVAPRVLDPLAPTIASLAFGHLPGEHGWRARKKLSAYRIAEHASGSQVSIGGDYGRAEIRLQTIGQFNVVNALAALRRSTFEEITRSIHTNFTRLIAGDPWLHEIQSTLWSSTGSRIVL